MADVMNGIPSIVFGIFAYAVCVLPMKTFSALSGGFALGHHDDPYDLTHQRAVCADGAFSIKGGWLGFRRA